MSKQHHDNVEKNYTLQIAADFFAFFAANAIMHRMEETSVQCPTCGEYFSVMGPSWEELPAEWDYDCEICCRPMILVFDESGGYARGLGE